MPLVQRNYPVGPGASNTGFGGSSYGAVAALYTAMIKPGVFGRLLIESPSLYVGDRHLLRRARAARRWPSRIYLGVGTAETNSAEINDETVRNVDKLAAHSARPPPRARRLQTVVEEGATHSEDAWARRLPQALEFLLRPTPELTVHLRRHGRHAHTAAGNGTASSSLRRGEQANSPAWPVRRHSCAKRGERLAAMADGRLFARGQFGERAPERRVEKDRVVAEPVVAARLRDDRAFDRPLGLEEDVDPAARRRCGRRTAPGCVSTPRSRSSSWIFANLTA